MKPFWEWKLDEMQRELEAGMGGYLRPADYYYSKYGDYCKDQRKQQSATPSELED